MLCHSIHGHAPSSTLDCSLLLLLLLLLLQGAT
jgi:hypothetical protein